jgi:hypothetical protein
MPAGGTDIVLFLLIGRLTRAVLNASITNTCTEKLNQRGQISPSLKTNNTQVVVVIALKLSVTQTTQLGGVG